MPRPKGSKNKKTLEREATQPAEAASEAPKRRGRPAKNAAPAASAAPVKAAKSPAKAAKTAAKSAAKSAKSAGKGAAKSGRGRRSTPILPETIGVGIIGAGGIARCVHIPGYQKLSNVLVVAVSDPVEAARNGAAQQFGKEKT